MIQIMQLKNYLAAAANLGGGGVHSGVEKILIYRYRSSRATPSPNLVSNLKTDNNNRKITYFNQKIPKSS